MGDALARLSGTRIETNIETAGKRERAGFGLIDSWRVIERDRDDKMVAVEVSCNGLQSKTACSQSTGVFGSH